MDSTPNSGKLWFVLLGILAMLASLGCTPRSEEITSALTTAADPPAKEIELLNVSYDATRELYKSLNVLFMASYQKKTGIKVNIKQSHGGSSSQARAVIDGLDADVVTLGMTTDTDAIHKAGLIAENWSQRLPQESLPYFSTIVFVVRKGNPKKISDWPDLVQTDIEIITPSPKTSGNGKLAFLAAWGSVKLNGGDDEQARTFVTKLYQRVPVLDAGARGATTTFAQKQIGDVHLTWENEGCFEVRQSNGALELIYPTISILAEPRVAWVDANVDRKGTAEVAKAYLEFLYTDAAQELIASHYYRPSTAAVLNSHRGDFPSLRLFTIGAIAEDWQAAETKFFGDGGIFDSIYQLPTN